MEDFDNGPDTSWRGDAKCMDYDPVMWENVDKDSSLSHLFEEYGAERFHLNNFMHQAARYICRSCPVRQECLEDAQSYDPPDTERTMRGGVGPTVMLEGLGGYNSMRCEHSDGKRLEHCDACLTSALEKVGDRLDSIV